MERITNKDFLSIMSKFKKVRLSHRIMDFNHMELMIMDMVIGRSKEGEKLLTTSELAYNMCVSKPAISRSIGVMEEKQYIKRINDKVDKRVIYMQVTERGRAAYAKATEEMDLFFDTVFQKFDNEKSHQLLNLMEELLIIIEAEVNEWNNKKGIDNDVKHN